MQLAVRSAARLLLPAYPDQHATHTCLQALVAEMVGNFSKRLEPYGVKVGYRTTAGHLVAAE